MATRRHVLTRDGAIVAITRSQLGDAKEKFGKGIRKTFIDLYSQLTDEKIKQAYLSEFGIELEIVELK